MGLDTRKPVLRGVGGGGGGVGLEQQRVRLASIFVQSDQCLYYSLIGKYHIKTCSNQNFREHSGRVLDSRPKGRRVEPYQCHCVVVLEQDTFILD